jgi:RNase P subunit RPR2
VRKRAFVEGLGRRFRRSTCGRCAEPVEWLGEAVRVDLAEGGFQVVHCCLPCLQRYRLSAAGGKVINHAKEVWAA